MKLLGEGRNRSVYLLPSGKYVLKVPKNEDGNRDNSLEAIRYRNRQDWQNLARCKMVPGTFLLVMEYVDVNIPSEEKPDWTKYVDGGQVGYTLKGKIVAYDYGN